MGIASSNVKAARVTRRIGGIRTLVILNIARENIKVSRMFKDRIYSPRTGYSVLLVVE